MINKSPMFLLAGVLLSASCIPAGASAGTPLARVHDARLTINPDVLGKLRALRHGGQFDHLPGVGNAAEKARLSKEFQQVLEGVIAGVSKKPSKRWVLSQFEISLKQVQNEDTEAREHFGTALEQIMDVLAIESSDGLLAAYLGGI